MQEILQDIESWLNQGLPIGLATVIQTWSSAPRQVGAKMAFTTGNTFSGSVSAGCVEGAVYEAGLRTLANGVAQLLQFGVSDELAMQAGLSCGGTIQVFVRRLEPSFIQDLRKELASQKSFAIVSLLPGDGSSQGQDILVNENGVVGNQLDSHLKRWLEDTLPAYLPSARCELLEPSLPGRQGERCFIDVIAPPPFLVVVGGVHIALPLVSLAKTIGFRTCVVDPRRAFANPERFPQADQIIPSWPEDAFLKLPLERSTAVAVLSHDPKIDDPALKIALQSPAFYIGALGSKKTHRERCHRLKQAGMTSAQLKRIHSPIGFDLGSQSPEEIALSILAEIVSIQHTIHQPPSTCGKIGQYFSRAFSKKFGSNPSK